MIVLEAGDGTRVEVSPSAAERSSVLSVIVQSSPMDFVPLSVLSGWCLSRIAQCLENDAALTDAIHQEVSAEPAKLVELAVASDYLDISELTSALCDMLATRIHDDAVIQPEPESSFDVRSEFAWTHL